MRKLLLFAYLLICLTSSAQKYLAGGINEVITRNVNLAGVNYASYFDVYNFETQLGETKQTPAPLGYEAFYISSYHRHGSRWLGSTKQYQAPITVLEKAEEKKLLTQTGLNLLNDLKKVLSISGKDNLGQLTDVGAAQHKAIAERMIKNFPTIFDGKGEYYAQSSKVKRCVNSMNAECKVIESATHCKVTQENGKPGMQDRIAGHYKTAKIDSMNRKGYSISANEKAKMTPYKRICASLFTDSSFLTVKEQKQFVLDLYYVAKNMRSHNVDITLWKYFNKSEIETLWTIENRVWYYVMGESPATGSICSLKARNQLVDILNAADSVVSRKKWHGTNLRFGHDMYLFPLACLMELGTCGRKIPQDKIDTLDKYWRGEEISPMAGNIQLVFYRPKNGIGDILVKAMLCEREVTLPGKAVSGPYYSWKEIRKYWKSKIGG